MKGFLFIFLLGSMMFQLCETNPCYQSVYLNGDLRTPKLSQIQIINQTRIICVVAPKTDQYYILSTSFIPTRCIRYNQDATPSIHPNSSEYFLYTVEARRDTHCLKSQMALKETLQINPGNILDSAIFVYFTTALSGSICIFVALVIYLNKTQSENKSKY